MLAFFPSVAEANNPPRCVRDPFPFQISQTSFVGFACPVAPPPGIDALMGEAEVPVSSPRPWASILVLSRLHKFCVPWRWWVGGLGGDLSCESAGQKGVSAPGKDLCVSQGPVGLQCAGGGTWATEVQGERQDSPPASCPQAWASPPGSSLGLGRPLCQGPL